MDSRSAFFALIAATALVCVSSRAVNISNTWMLPEEGFPVFYRYFRDRISWYEADAVCQFHHANLVTVDSTSEYDSVRAYLKELDIVNNVWIGLSKNSEKAQFSWRDFRPLTNEGHWQEAIPVGNTPLCAATDPAADFGWHALPCGGSEVASFICELTVPSWSTGPKGCLLTELPSLTVLYLPEQSAIELTSDCGLDGTKRIACKGNADREEMMRQLSCSITNDDFDDKTTRGSISESTIGEITNPSQSPNTKSTKPWIWTSNTISTGDYGTPTRHRRETENTIGPDSSTQSTADLKMKEQKISTRLDVTTIPSKIISATSKQMLEMATVNNVNDVTLDLSVTQKSSNPSETIATVTQDSTTLKYNNKPEEQEESFSMAISTPNSNAQDGNLDEVGEYPGVINQGQLFSIIENGTMFDIIELNETGTEETRDSGFTLSQDNYKISSEIQSSTEQSLNSRALYTTIIYHKEPPEDINANNDRVKTQLKHDPTPTIKIFESKGKPNEKSSAKHKTLNDLLTKEDDKTLTKEIEMFPIVADSSIKLNRTYRKKLPMSESNLTKEEGEESYGNVDDFIIGDETSNHKVVEIKLHTDNNKSNIKTKLFVTTKLADKNKQVNKNGKVITNNVKNRNVIENKKDNIEKFDDVPINSVRTEGEEKEIEIDPRIEELNTRMINMSRNIDSEIISPIPFQETNLKTQFLPKSLLEDSDEISKSPELIINDLQRVSSTIDNPTPDTLDSVPQQQPRPNRQRLLTKPQRRSFYPYFFSRVLG